MNRLLKGTITLFITLAFLMIAFPFSKYFILASYQEKIKIEEVKELPTNIPQPEMVHSPTISDTVFVLRQDKISSLGQIVIPEIGVSQPILAGLTSINMVKGVVSLFPDRNPDQSSLTLIGHHVLYYNWGNPLLFGGIQKLKVNDPIYIRYLGEDYYYQVESNNLIKDSDIDRLSDKGPNYLLLVTCNAAETTPYRVLITAKKIYKEKIIFKKELEKTNKIRTSQYMKFFVLPLIVAFLVYILLIFLVWRV